MILDKDETRASMASGRAASMQVSGKRPEEDEKSFLIETNEMDVDTEYFEEVLQMCRKNFSSNSIQNRLKLAKVKENPKEDLIEIYNMIKRREKDETKLT
jgi:hypothetical protein